jgi:hypothetical protein
MLYKFQSTVAAFVEIFLLSVQRNIAILHLLNIVNDYTKGICHSSGVAGCLCQTRETGSAGAL